MPRGPRLDAPGVLHHVMARGIERRKIFLDDRDRDDFVSRLAALAKAGAVVVYAWSLMPNHLHLLVRSGNLPISHSMRRLLTGYAVVFNRRHRRSGHLFQNRYKSIVVEEESYLLELVRYIHLNPIRSGVVRDLAHLDRWPYSGHSALLGRVLLDWQETGEVWGRYSRSRREAARRYRAFVAEGRKQGQRPELMGGGLIRSAGGWQAVSALRKGRERYASDERVLGSSAFVDGLLREAEKAAGEREKGRRTRVTLETLAERIGRDVGIPAGILLSSSRNRSVSRARALLSCVWVGHLGRSGYELARGLGVSPVSVYLSARRGQELMAEWKDRLERWCR